MFFIATILAGAINASAGGGGLITFPLLMLVVTPVSADATSAVALFFAYPTAVWRTRTQLEGVLSGGTGITVSRWRSAVLLVVMLEA